MELKCGLEIHQRIAGRKLFCDCDGPSSSNEGGHFKNGAVLQQAVASGTPAEFSRHLHAVQSELGESDSAVRLEASRNRAFGYVAPRQSCCLVEADDEPPHRINREALGAVLLFCRLLSSQTVDVLHVMRKNVIDGSNTSGFQRTVLVGTGGSVETPSGALEIQSICIEEESAGILEGRESSARYDLSRLGIPLVEIATEPALKSGEQAQAAALAIGTLLRKTGLVARGIGTIRQDLNVSIPKGARVEIKGVQELSIIAATINIEVSRQQKLLALSSEIARKLSGKPIEPLFIDLTEIFEGTASPLVARLLRSNARVIGLRLPMHEGLLGRELAENRRYGSELADYARAAGISGLIHSDEDMTKYGFSEDELSEARLALSLETGDAFALVVGEQKKALSAISEVCRRANFQGVPEETRKAKPDGTSSYMRPLPGRARMYPETDVPTIPITSEMLASAGERAKLLEKAEGQKEEILSSINGELSAQLSAAKGLLSHNPNFKMPSGAATPELAAFAAATSQGADAKFAASVLTNALQSLKREGAATLSLDEPRLVAFLLAHKEGVFAKSAAVEILRAMCEDRNAAPKDATAKLALQKITGRQLAKLISDEKLDLKGLMSKYRLRVDAAEAQELLKSRSPN